MSVRHQTLSRLGQNIGREAVGLSQEALAEKAQFVRKLDQWNWP